MSQKLDLAFKIRTEKEKKTVCSVIGWQGGKHSLKMKNVKQNENFLN